MDGTLVDSEKVWDIGLYELATHFGGELSLHARQALVGSSMERSIQILYADIGQPWRDPGEGTEWLIARMKELFAMGLEWRPGAKRLLAEVRAAGIPAALVTSTNRSIVDVALRMFDRDSFDVVVCGDEVPFVKPDPTPYLTAADLLGAPIGRCVAIEDSPVGIASARAAGAVVVAVPSHVPLVDVAGVVLLDSLEEVDLARLESLTRTR